MISRLPPFAWAGAWILAFLAGMINVVGLLSFAHQTVTHLTGTTSMVAAALVDGDWQAGIRLASIVASFFAGTILSGFLIQDSAFQLRRSYGVVLFLESMLLFLSVPLLASQNVLGIDCAAGACGLQNAMVTTYSGAVIRTTHISGMFTDLGIFLGHVLRGMTIDRWRLRVCLIVISGFFLGGVGGAFAFHAFGGGALLVPASVLVFAALICGSARQR